MPKEYAFENKKYSEEEVREYIKNNPEECDSAFWVDISCDQDLSEDFIREFQDKVYWNYISANQNLSENFIREFQDKVNWFDISWKEDLSEDFIREFQDKVNWFYISEKQELSEKFLIEFIDKIEIGNNIIYGLIDNEKIPEDVRKRIINLKKVQDA